MFEHHSIGINIYLYIFTRVKQKNQSLGIIFLTFCFMRFPLKLSFLSASLQVALTVISLLIQTFHLFPGSNISEMRKSYKDAFLKKHNMKLGFMSAFVKAAAYALADQPAVNAGTDLNFTCSVTCEMVSACMKPCMCGVRPHAC